MAPDEFESLARKAFAVAVHELIPLLRPEALLVAIEPGSHYSECRLHYVGGITIRGNFYHLDNDGNDGGSVFITMVEIKEDVVSEPLLRFPSSWHHLYSIDDDYNKMVSGQSLSWELDQIRSYIDNVTELTYLIQAVFQQIVGVAKSDAEKGDALEWNRPAQVRFLRECLAEIQDSSRLSPGLCERIKTFVSRIDIVYLEVEEDAGT